MDDYAGACGFVCVQLGVCGQWCSTQRYGTVAACEADAGVAGARRWGRVTVCAASAHGDVNAGETRDPLVLVSVAKNAAAAAAARRKGQAKLVMKNAGTGMPHSTSLGSAQQVGSVAVTSKKDRSSSRSGMAAATAASHDAAMKKRRARTSASSSSSAAGSKEKSKGSATAAALKNVPRTNASGSATVSRRKAAASPASSKASSQRRTKKSAKARLNHVFKPGDLVRHPRYGVGRFTSIQVSNDQVSIQEFASISYIDGDVLVPLVQIEMLSPYEGDPEGDNFRIDAVAVVKHLDERKQHRTTSRARRQVRTDIRQHIVSMFDMYAQRASFMRPPHTGNAKLERHFEKQFPYTVTDDQAAAIKDILSDMSERAIPMDRLLCGDVGFGKTEVAMRAIFRALCSGYQVGLLAPTTILAHQHYKTLVARLQHYPQFRVGRMTRFVKALEQEETVEAIRTGDIQVLVGTHSVIGSRVEFKKLGLLVVDEEHRFGVNQKEKLRSLHRGIDVLTLSATPIPRTLHISMSGLRDVSVIRTPPSSRKAVITKIVTNEVSQVLRHAIQLELNRQGQLFYVVPRIHAMADAEKRLLDLFPDLRIIKAHAELRDLEDRVLDFACGAADVLLCTTIIENGIDLPQVNTIIIDHATQFGLAQLHQLRGRVGRSDQQAYAYLLSENVQAQTIGYERISALAEMSELGSGFALANKDMELRGVGNIMGVEQSGRLGGLEPEEYTSILFEELEIARSMKLSRFARSTSSRPELRDAFPPVKYTQVNVPVSAYVPSEYVGGNMDKKLMVYAALANCSSMEELEYAKQFLAKKYGPAPPEMEMLYVLTEVKLYGKTLGINRIYPEMQHVVLEWGIDESHFQTLTKEFRKTPSMRRKFVHVPSDERVQVRGLALVQNDQILLKLKEWLSVFYVGALQIIKQRKKMLAALRSEPDSGSSRLLNELRGGSKEK
ncbi:Transcription-repair-coupling factor [Porphyridium purpureum]|uniref:Transcription-repair-coupling factor n=1 Tax=Porphyridium purpureum TaxID=35688 RepID=A0A5J4Z1B2_PORPP|nr:Transcription-repair-coupling factor [Porphyridium purpureum]|eukprot:POR1209..scf208_2